MAFAPSFTVSQSVGGSIVTITDTSNYGDGGNFNKSGMVSRTLYITPGDTLVQQTINFPYTNTNNSIQDTYQFNVTQDYVYSITMTLIDNASIEYTVINQVIITEFTNKKLREILSEYSTCGCSSSCQSAEKIQCGLDAATARACAADISGAQQILEYINELADNKVNC